jgi:hypothetical protein
MIHKQTITEALADYMVTVNCDASTAVDALSERFIEDIMKAEKIEPNYEEMDILNEVIVDALEDFTEDAEALVNEWNEDARQMEEERREALRGRY